MPLHFAVRTHNIIPDIFSDFARTRRSQWFSYVRTVIARQTNSEILPPTCSKFLKAWNYMARYSYERNIQADSPLEVFHAISDTNLLVCPSNLRREFGNEQYNRKHRETQAAYLHAKIIATFNLISNFDKEINNYTSAKKIDFVCGTSSSLTAVYSINSNRKILYINNDKLKTLLRFFIQNNHQDFFQFLFNEIYIHINRSTPTSAYNFSNNNTQTVQAETPPQRPVVATTTEQEYFGREEEIEENITNQEVAAMIQTSESLPKEILKAIQDIVIATRISVPIEE